MTRLDPIFQEDYDIRLALRKQYRMDYENSFYVYLHRKRSNGQIFYVGKGSSVRAWINTGRGTHWDRVVKKHGLIVDILFQGLTSDEAYKVEQDVILELSSFNFQLINKTAGGEGGFKPSDETRKLMSIAKIGKEPHNIDKNKHLFLQINTGLEFIGTRKELCQTFNLTQKQVGKLFKSEPRKSSAGWSLLKRNYDGKT